MPGPLIRGNTVVTYYIKNWIKFLRNYGPFVSFWNLKLKHHSILFAVIRCHLIYHSLSFVVTCHSLPFLVRIAVIHCASPCYSLSLVTAPFVTRCRGLSLVVTRCSTRLSFYKRSPFKSQAFNFIKNKLQHRCFSVSFTKFLRTHFSTEHLRVTASNHRCLTGCLIRLLILNSLMTEILII